MKIKIVAIIIIVSFLLAGCGKGKDKSPVLNENGKEEITLGDTFLDDYLKNAIVDYNKQSDRYEVVLYELPEEMIPLDARKRVQLDLANGKGPDIMVDEMFNDIDMTPYAEDGYLMDLTDFKKEFDDVIDGVGAYNTIDGVVYGIPIAFSIGTVTASSSLNISRENSTVERWMELTINSDSRIPCSAYGILDLFGVGVDGIQLFVDEEKRISYFDTQEFIELLEFAKRYERLDDGMTEHKRILSSKQLFKSCYINEFGEFWYQENLFEETPSYIGYPSESGGRTLMNVNNMYINKKTEHEEGAKDFIRFLMSEEQQRNTMKYYLGFPAREKVLRKIWEEAKTTINAGWMNYGRGESDGVVFESRLMRDDEEELFFSLLDRNLIYNNRISPISDIVYEETLPFFEGKKTAGEVAKIIDNRVQLYLDEKK